MNNVFLFLSLLSFVGLIVGIIKPSLFKQTRKRVGLGFGGGIILFFILFGVTSPKSQEVASTPQQPTFAQLAMERFDTIKSSIPELKDIHCEVESCTGVIYFNFTKLPDDLETIVRGNAATFSKFEMDNSGVSHVSIFAQLDGKDVFHCEAAYAKVTSCSK